MTSNAKKPKPLAKNCTALYVKMDATCFHILQSRRNFRHWNAVLRCTIPTRHKQVPDFIGEPVLGHRVPIRARPRWVHAIPQLIENLVSPFAFIIAKGTIIAVSMELPWARAYVRVVIAHASQDRASKLPDVGEDSVVWC
jgi:hypothetical protein